MAPSHDLLPVTRDVPPRDLEGTIERTISEVPAPRTHAVSDPDRASEEIAKRAARQAAVLSGSLALPPGPFGLLTVLPDLYLIWKTQRQMVADIFALYGRTAELSRSHMLYCLFRHAAAQAMRDFAVQVGARLLIQDIPLRALERAAARIGVSLSQRLAARSLSRWLPVAGAVGVGVYAWHDTAQVARTATALFAGAPPPDTRRARRLKRGEQSVTSPETPQADSSSD